MTCAFKMNLCKNLYVPLWDREFKYRNLKMNIPRIYIYQGINIATMTCAFKMNLCKNLYVPVILR